MENNIIKEFKNLKKDISPRPEWVALSRDILLQQINPRKQYKSAHISVGGYSRMFLQIFRQQLLEPAVIMLLILGVFLGSSLTINAAFYSLPGDGLYKVKLALEKTHLALTPNEEKKVELKVEFAQKRAAEFDKIVQQVNVDPEKRKKNIQAVVKEFRNNVVSVNDHLNKINQAIRESEDIDKAQTVRMAVSIGNKTEELAKTIDEKIEELSVVDQLEVEAIVAEAVQSAQETSLSTQQLVEGVNQPTEEGEGKEVESVVEEEGVVQGSDNQPAEEEDTTEDETVEMQITKIEEVGEETIEEDVIE